MDLNFERLLEPQFNGDIKEVFDSLEAGVFDLALRLDDYLQYEWYRFFNECNETVGYGWVSIIGDEFEISLVVKEQYRGNKELNCGEFIIQKLEQVAKDREFETVLVTVKGTNPQKVNLAIWFYKQGFNSCESDTLDNLIKFMSDLPPSFDFSFYKNI